MLTYKQALEIFARYIQIECKECGANVGELCNTKALWVHRCRIEDTIKDRKSGKKT